MHPSRLTACALMTVAVLAACTSGAATSTSASSAARTSSAAESSPSADGAPGASTGDTAATPGAVPTTADPAPHPVSLQALMAKTYDGRSLRLGRERGSTSAYRQYAVTYEGSGLRISGRINIPRGMGPFPAVVLAHGYVDPEVYANGETMLRERDYLARRGYITLHIDYRNHAQSDDDPDNDANLRLGYTEDAINAALALQKDSRVIPDRIALIGRSMGGGVVFNVLVVKPGLFKAAVAYSPVSSDSVDNFDKWVRRDSSRSGVAQKVIARLGTPEAQPQRWADVSPRTFFGRISDPLLIHHGTSDEDCPIQWSRDTVAALEAAGKDVTYYEYPGQRHTFVEQWPLSIRRTAAFLEKNLT